MPVPSEILSTVRNQIAETTAKYYTDAEIYAYMTEAEGKINKKTDSYELTPD